MMTNTPKNIKSTVSNTDIDDKPKKLKTCFIIMPIADHDTYEIVHFDRV